MSGFHVTMLLLFLVIVFYICKSGALAQGSPSFSEESFTEYALEAAKALYPEQQWTKKDVLVLQANKAGTIYLYNLFREVGSKAPQLRAVTTCLYLKKLVETMTDSSDIDDWSAI